jgi:Uma2 family endonuclease
MNVQAAITRPQPVKLTVTDFRLLKRAGAFAGYSKSELLDGMLWGVPVQNEDEPESDAVYPIKLRIEDYWRLYEAGAFDDYGKTELIDGRVYAMNPQHRRHMRVKCELVFRLRLALEAIGSTLFVGEGTVAMPPSDAPEPDIVLTSEPEGDGPVPLSSVALLVEVGDSTVRFDLEQMADRYALHGVPEYWVVDVNARVIHQMWTPESGTYSNRRKVRLGERIEAVTIDALGVETSAIH